MTSNASPASSSGLPAGLGAATVALFLWAWPSVIAKTLPLDPVVIVFYRGWLGVAWALGFLYLLRGGRLSWRCLRVCFWGGVALAFDLVFFFTAIKMTTIANATVITAMQPVLLVFLAPLLFRERVGRVDIATAAVALLGVAGVVRGSSDSESWSLTGDIFAVLTLVAWTGYMLASKRAHGRVRSAEFAASVSLIATVLVTPLALFMSRPLPVPTQPQWLLLAVMALCGWGGHILMNWALGRIPLWVGGMVSLAIPVVASAMAAILLGESLLPIQILGMAIVMASLTVVCVRSPKLLGAEAPGAG